MTAEHERLKEARERGTRWRNWGPYLRERQWGIARENQGAEDPALRDLTYEQARSWAYEWGEDGLAGISDEQMRLCFAVALWNGRDLTLKERLGPASEEADEVSKDRCIYLDNVPTHSYMRALYKYSACFDVLIEYAKASAEQILIRITLDNRGSEQAMVHVLPTLWFRNTWQSDSAVDKPLIERSIGRLGSPFLIARHPTAGLHYLQYESAVQTLFTNNESNMRCFDRPNVSRWVKDGICENIVNGVKDAVNPTARGTKAAVHYELTLAPGRSRSVRLQLGAGVPSVWPLASLRFDSTLQQRRREAEQFYTALTPEPRDARLSRTFRRAFATALWNKQTYLYDMSGWLYDRRGAPDSVPSGRTRYHVASSRVLAMPNKWQPTHLGASHAILHALALTHVDPDIACNQLESLLSALHIDDVAKHAHVEERYDTSLHAWATLLMYRLQRPYRPQRAFIFLRHAFNLLRAQEPDNAWIGLHVQSMFEIAVELALMSAQYEQTAIELYLRFVTVIGAIDLGLEARVPNAVNERNNPALRPVRPANLISVCAAAMFPETIYKRLPALVEYVHALTRERAGPFTGFKPLKVSSINGRRILSIVDESTLRALIVQLVDQQAVAASTDRPFCSVSSGAVLVRALLCLHDYYGEDLRVTASTRGGPARTLADVSADIVQRMSSSVFARSSASSKVDPGIGKPSEEQWSELMPLYQRLYSDETDNSGRTGWAGVIAPLLCVACGYRIVESTACHAPPVMRIAYRRGDRASEDSSFNGAGLDRGESIKPPLEVSSEWP